MFTGISSCDNIICLVVTLTSLGVYLCMHFVLVAFPVASIGRYDVYQCLFNISAQKSVSKKKIIQNVT